MKKYFMISIIRTIVGFIFFPFRIDNKRILFYSFSGKDYSDSPKYISEYLQKSTGNIEIIWALKDPQKYVHLLPKNIKVIKYNSILHLFYGSTAKIIVTNTGPYKAIKYKKNQIIINTWHGGGAYKKTGMDNPYKNKYQVLYNKNLAQAGVKLFISSSKAFTKYVIRGAFDYKGEVIECGLPRNDILLNPVNHSQIIRKVKSYFRIDERTKIVLYAPTWKNYSTQSIEILSADSVINACEKKFGGDWKFLYRGHNLSNGVSIENIDLKTIDVTDYSDMQELMIASDILISDYSSCVWDFSLLMRPCFLFSPDLEQYNATFSFYTPINSWGFSVSKSNKELISNILMHDPIEYLNRIDSNHKNFGIKETGHATDAVCDYINTHMYKSSIS